MPNTHHIRTRNHSKPASYEYISSAHIGDCCYSEYSFAAEAKDNQVIRNPVEGSLYVIFCSEGGIFITEKSEKKKSVNKHQMTLIFGRSGEFIKIGWQEGEVAKFSLIELKMPAISNAVASSFPFLKDHLDNKIADSTLIFVGEPLPKLQKKFEALMRHTKRKQPSELIIKGLMLQTFGFVLEQVYRNVEGIKEEEVLSDEDIVIVRHIADVIQHHPEQEVSLKLFSDKSGLTENKLQIGFQMEFGRKLLPFVQHVRLKKARQLMLTTEMTIAQIVYSVGLTSRSIFADLFKEKYGCSPNYFQEQFRLKSGRI